MAIVFAVGLKELPHLELNDLLRFRSHHLYQIVVPVRSYGKYSALIGSV